MPTAQFRSIGSGTVMGMNSRCSDEGGVGEGRGGWAYLSICCHRTATRITRLHFSVDPVPLVDDVTIPAQIVRLCW